MGPKIKEIFGEIFRRSSQGLVEFQPALGTCGTGSHQMELFPNSRFHWLTGECDWGAKQPRRDTDFPYTTQLWKFPGKKLLGRGPKEFRKMVCLWSILFFKFKFTLFLGEKIFSISKDLRHQIFQLEEIENNNNNNYNWYLRIPGMIKNTLLVLTHLIPQQVLSSPLQLSHHVKSWVPLLTLSLKNAKRRHHLELCSPAGLARVKGKRHQISSICILLMEKLDVQ